MKQMKQMILFLEYPESWYKSGLIRCCIFLEFLSDLKLKKWFDDVNA